jgi:uncharacterized protein YecE (DUF72 family)
MLHIGTCGWDYPHWRGGLYPATVSRHGWLAHYASAFGALEVDTTFYRVPPNRVAANWAAATPEHFTMAIKASRYLTHVRRLHEPRQPLQLLREHLAPLGPRLGPLVVQLPPTASVDLDALGALLAVTAEWDWPVAVEPRHDSWFTRDFDRLLARHHATAVWTDWWGHTNPHTRTADWGYVRLHAGRAHPDGAYGRTALATWLDRITSRYAPHHEVFVMFNNDAHGCAPHNAAEFAALARDRGLVVGRAPDVGRVPLVA